MSSYVAIRFKAVLVRSAVPLALIIGSSISFGAKAVESLDLSAEIEIGDNIGRDHHLGDRAHDRHAPISLRYSLHCRRSRGCARHACFLVPLKDRCMLRGAEI